MNVSLKIYRDQLWQHMSLLYIIRVENLAISVLQYIIYIIGYKDIKNNQDDTY